MQQAHLDQEARRAMNDKPVTKQATCPQCRRQFTYSTADEPKWLPFCCDRCQWIDLGKWLNGEFRISRDVQSNDLEQKD
jgi:endogenous inhibitor of DNA gyrase (YacG/DUF329 family)